MKSRTKRIGVGIAAGLTLGVAALATARLRKQRQMQRSWSSLETPSRSERFHPEMVEGLPRPAQRYLLRAIQPGARLATSVRLRIAGSIRLARGSVPMPMASEEQLAPPVGYVWKARVRKGVVRLSGFDLYCDGHGEMRWWVAGVVPIVRSEGSELARSAAGRLLGEAIFIPSVLLPSDHVRWDAIDESSARVQLFADGEEVAMTLEVDPEGRLVHASFPRWNTNPEVGPVGYLPFVTERFAEERTFSGYMIPTRFESGWSLGEPDELRFFFGKIEGAEYTP